MLNIYTNCDCSNYQNEY